MRILVKGGIWKNTEDEILKAAVMKYGKNQWARIASLLSKKSAKQCKARWYEWLDPSIKKTEWSREEEEKLLHLAKIMPCQWRTIAPIVGRTAAQCLEHYEKLLDAASNKEESFDPSDDPRRLRPGEIDPNPEAKPARPDRVDLEEDEKEMLQEARARLANTKGKKAKRKAREKQLEEARRLAAVQKRRELKAAGISVAPQPTRKKQRSGMDYNKEVPFLHRPAPGFHSTESEYERERLLTKDPNFNTLTLQKLEGERRDDVEEKAKQKDVDKLKQRMQKATPDVLAQMQKKTDKNIRRSKLVMPSPQMADEEVREIAKMSYEPEAEDEEEGNEATRDLLSRYEPTPRASSSASSASTGPMTPSVRGNETRTPLRPNTIMSEAQNLIAITTASTPLLGGDNAPLNPTDFSSALPKRKDIMTPNPLATPSLQTSTGMTPRITDGSATPMRTPLRDQLNINEGTGDFGDDEEVGKRKKKGEEQPKLDIKSGLAALPKPREYKIAMPELPDDDVEMTDADSETRDPVRVGSATSVPDASDIERHNREKQRAEEEQRLALRSEVLKRDFPRPFKVNGAFSKPLKEIEAMPHDDASLVLVAQEMIKHEMVMMMTNDAVEYPTKQIRPPAKINPQTWKFEQFSEQELKQAKKLLDREVATLSKAFGTPTDSEFSTTWERCHEDLVYLPHVKKYTLNSMIKNDMDKVRAVKHQFDVVKQDFKRQNKKAAGAEKPLSVYLGGYFKVAETKEKSIHELRKKIAQTRIELECFSFLKQNEGMAIPQRIEALKQVVDEQHTQESQLQTSFANLVAKKNELMELYHAQLKAKKEKEEEEEEPPATEPSSLSSTTTTTAAVTTDEEMQEGEKPSAV